MSINASQIVQVTPRVINAGGTDLEITGLLLTTNPLCVFPGTMAYTSADAVGAYFGLASAEYKAAEKYFLGYNNSFKKPRRLHFARLATTALAGALIGASAADVATLQGITDGVLTLNIDGVKTTANAIDFSAITTQSDAATILTTALEKATVEYNSNLNAFIITSSTTGNASAVSVAEESPLATAMGFTAAAGAVESAGSAALEPGANMDSITNVTQNWVSFTTLEEADDDTVMAFAEWASNSNGEYLYCPYTTNKANIQPSNAASLTAKLTKQNYEGVLLTYGGLNHAVFAMSIAACIDWDRNNGIVTWAFKSQDGLAASVEDDATAANCAELGVNFYGNYATRNDDFIFYHQGKMIGGKFGFVDAYVGNLWLRNALQVAIVNGLNQVGRVPYVDKGYTLIRAWCTDPINRALTSGVIDPGLDISEAQRAQLMYEIGEDVSSEIFTKGYYLLIADPGASARENRDTPTLGLWYTYGGSVHRVELPVTAVL